MIILRTTLGPDHSRQSRQALLEATALLEKLLHDFPDEPNYTEELALTQMRLAMTGLPPGEARKCFRRALALLDNLHRRFPERPQYRFELATCLVNSAGVFFGPDAETRGRRAVALLEELCRTPAPDPQHLRWLAEANHSLAEDLGLLGRAPEAVELCRKALDVIQQLVPDRLGLPEYQHALGPYEWHDVGVLYRTLGQSLGHAGKLKEAESAFAQAIRIHKKLVADFPKTHHYWLALFNDYLAQGMLCWTRGRKDQVDQAYQQAQELGERMVAAFPPPHVVSGEVARFLVACPDPKYRGIQRGVEVARIGTTAPEASRRVWTTLAIGQYRAGDYEKALTTLQHLLRRWPEEPQPGFLLALVHWQLDHRDRAFACYRAAAEWTEKNRPADDELRLFRAEAAELLGIEQKND
jgi:tetratricopeptide (TPR) repeat protein